MKSNNKDIIKNTPEQKQMLKKLLNEVKDLPIFEEKINEMNAILKDASFATPA